MQKLTNEIIHFFHNQRYVIVSTVDRDGGLHSACKGIVDIQREGKVYLLDLYKGATFDNLIHNRHISITAVDEHRFRGYCLAGKAKIIKSDALEPHLLKAWEDKITSRVTHRIIKNIQGEKGHPKHPEILLPRPAYMIVMEVNKVIDLTPRHLKEEG